MMMTSLDIILDIIFFPLFFALFFGGCVESLIETAECDTLELILFWTIFGVLVEDFWEKNRIPNVAKHQMIWQFPGACSSCATGPRRSIPYMPLDLEVARLYCPKEMDLRRALQAMKLKVFLKMAPSRSFFFPHCEPSTTKRFFWPK